jgi:release factor glutamine methyltransferase
MPPIPHIDPDTVAFLRAAGCVYAEDEARILTEAAHSAADLRALLDRRAQGEPIEYVVGWAEFCGLRVPVRTGVFVPRRRSEFLAECGMDAVQAAADRASGSRRVKVLDLCCGSGAVGLAVALRAGIVELLAADDSPAAVSCARQNLARVGGRVYEGDLFATLPKADLHSLDLIIANAPYVPTAEIRTLPAEARCFGPLSMLDGGPDGTSVQTRILEGAAEWLAARGSVLIETSGGMADATAQRACEVGFTVEVRRSAGMDATVIAATRRS